MDAEGGSTTPPATIVIVAWRDGRYLPRCLDALAANVPAHLFRTILILNEATDAARDRFRAGGTVTEVLAFRNNLGFGAAVNVAVERAITEFVVLLNDDCIVQPGWLEELIGTARRRPAAGAVGSTLLNLDGSLQEAGSILWADASTVAVGDGARDGAKRWMFERAVDFCSGASLLVRADAWRALGGIDERYYPGYYEDVDLSLRLAESGCETWLSPLSIALHTKGGSSSEGYRAFLSHRNRSVLSERWSDALHRQPDHEPIESAVWRAMGQPRRVLLVTDRDRQAITDVADVAALIAPVEAAADTLVAVCGSVPAEVGDDLARHGVRLIDDLAAHLSDPAVGYDDVVVAGEPSAGLRDLLATRLGAADPLVIGGPPAAAR